ncbi:P-loop containing nucleoside triphosphate hydrolase protein [Dioscorea alata]|uniref:P-loop containing nucleoside triphosphate hydrolase protein n=1 Tax=Dioscorea alata TaxID=55571 RepID=A0ACB7WM07_DIOAL|nr:P-loop containing nucleoside triphosphate hydrolase protein [Dioscorea alata]
MRWMESELRWIKSFIKDADGRGKRDENLKNWVNDVIQVAYLAKDAIDSFFIKVHHSKGVLSCIKRLKARRDVGKEICKIKERLNEIKARIALYGIQCSGEDGDALSLMLVRRRHFLSQPDDADIVGRFNDEKILLERLMNHHCQQQQGSCVISIDGIGGLGKTTLARKLYRSNAVSNHFHKCIWLTVSQENSLMGLLRKLLKQIPGITGDLKNKEENDLIDKINDSLKTKRILIVLDDIWREDVCVQMEGIFRNVTNGSRILITTRFLNVANRADPSSTPH